jgi:hypothetical protein
MPFEVLATEKILFRHPAVLSRGAFKGVGELILTSLRLFWHSAGVANSATNGADLELTWTSIKDRKYNSAKCFFMVLSKINGERFIFVLCQAGTGNSGAFQQQLEQLKAAVKTADPQSVASSRRRERTAESMASAAAFPTTTRGSSSSSGSSHSASHCGSNSTNSGPSADQVRVRQDLLAADASLARSFRDLVTSQKLVTEGEFWEEHEYELAAFCGATRAKKRGQPNALLSDVRDSDIVVQETAQAGKKHRIDNLEERKPWIFRAYPAVRRAYEDQVLRNPPQMSEQLFWVTYFKSWYFQRDRAPLEALSTTRFEPGAEQTGNDLFVRYETPEDRAEIAFGMASDGASALQGAPKLNTRVRVASEFDLTTTLADKLVTDTSAGSSTGPRGGTTAAARAAAADGGSSRSDRGGQLSAKTAVIRKYNKNSAMVLETSSLGTGQTRRNTAGTTAEGFSVAIANTSAGDSNSGSMGSGSNSGSNESDSRGEDGIYTENAELDLVARMQHGPLCTAEVMPLVLQRAALPVTVDDAETDASGQSPQQLLLS